MEHESSSPVALRTGRSQSRASEMSEGRQAPYNAEGFKDAALLPSTSIGLSLRTTVEGDYPVTEMASFQPMLVAEQQFDTNHRQQGVLDNCAAKAAPQRPSKADEIEGTSLPMSGMLMPKPLISDPMSSLSSTSHYPLNDGQPTTPCVQAYIIISRLNYRGLDSDSITAWLSPGFRRASLLQEECQVEMPDGGYRWVCLACCFTINCFTWGIVASRPLDYTSIGSLDFGIAMLSALLVTRLARTVGIRPLTLLGSFIFGGGFMAASFASHIWHLYLSQGVLVGLGVGFAYVPSIAVLSQWFAKRRSLANGISAAGSGIGGLVFSFATGCTIDHLGTGWALRITGVSGTLAIFVTAFFITDRNGIVMPKQHPFDRKLIRRLDVLLLLL
ncbi:uncharacterized protein PV06_06473 [Exophiala oligosperma]|uniref:Major facilitator superfamily (MFS) profile domain-containing protein n=1 Tax=Exophiala oligosperma TaxID=215243 RepID=A0A0D2E5B4_9EURO|nr:uncharacterized protein PV06_06473 [Exophiala oligosperma]KIW42984.1 hypothetical protein PV06_06473 [Exophiala oligosperma]